MTIGRPSSRWEINVKMYMKGQMYKGADWNHLSQVGASGGPL